MDTDTFIAKAELLQRLQAAKTQVDAVLAALPREQLAHPRADGRSIKDLLAHFIAHEQRALEELRSAARGQHPNIPLGDNDTFNLGAVLVSRPLPFEQVKAAWDRSFAEIVSTVQALDERDFAPSSTIAQLLDDTIDGALANNSYEHYLDHLHELQTVSSNAPQDNS